MRFTVERELFPFSLSSLCSVTKYGGFSGDKERSVGAHQGHRSQEWQHEGAHLQTWSAMWLKHRTNCTKKDKSLRTLLQCLNYCRALVGVLHRFGTVDIYILLYTQGLLFLTIAISMQLPYMSTGSTFTCYIIRCQQRLLCLIHTCLIKWITDDFPSIQPI